MSLVLIGLGYAAIVLLVLSGFIHYIRARHPYD